MARGLEYAFLPHGRLKIGETSPGSISESAANGDHSNLQGKKTTSPLQWFVDAMEVLCAMRGIGWDFGKQLYIPPGRQSVRRLLKAFAISFLSLDFMESTLKLLPQFSRPNGGSMFDQELPLVQRYLLSTFIHWLTGCCIIAFFEMLYSLLAILCITILRHDFLSARLLVETMASDTGTDASLLGRISTRIPNELQRHVSPDWDGHGHFHC